MHKIYQTDIISDLNPASLPVLWYLYFTCNSLC